MRIRAMLRAAPLAVAASILVVPGVVAPAAAGAPPPHAQTGDRAAEDAKRALERAAQDVKKGAEAAAGEVSKAFREVRDRLRTTREERRRKQVEEARQKWGAALLERPDVREEMKIHARRTARLRYIEGLAGDVQMNSIEARAKRALRLEDERFERQMNTLRSSGGAR